MFFRLLTLLGLMLTRLLGVDLTSQNILLTPHCEFFEDKSQTLDLDAIKKHPLLFSKNQEASKSFGLTGSVIWIKLVLENPTHRTIQRYIVNREYLINRMIFYWKDQKKAFGLVSLHDTPFIRPSFLVQLKPLEKAELFIKVHSPTNPIMIHLSAVDEQTHYEDAFAEQIIYALFFGLLLALIVYNLVIFSLIRQKLNFYYVGYLVSILIYYLGYTGMDRVYLYKGASEFFAYIGVYMISFMTIMSILFFKEFLQIRTLKIRRYFQVIIGVLVLTMLTMIYKPLYTLVVPIVLGIVTLLSLWIIAMYELKRKNRSSAGFFLVGWSPLILMFFVMVVEHFSSFNLAEHVHYYVQAAVIFEAIVFSFALALGIKRIESERNAAQVKLILEQKKAQDKLQSEVDKRTLELKQRLDERNILLREIHHRVKNNMQIVLSMLRLQSDTVDKKFQELILTAENRIRSMLSIHESLSVQEDYSSIDVKHYFERLIDEILRSLGCDRTKVSFIYACDDWDIDQLMLYGLVINELLSNACVHTQGTQDLHISVRIKQENHKNILEVEDNGQLFTSYDEKLGLTLVKTIVQEQLQGSFSLRYDKGSLATVQS